ncbi:unnamed protein product [Spirodela intermedia]|uniref:Uncharacterized protein n=1 Tax=Spirodela intermedia TaxID=51605 RepID=A0ABN7EB03_SPIIN|nr:unnamed protein product [Spirodela intermedia]
MHQILSIREDSCVVSTASKALLGQGRCGQSLDLLVNRLRQLSPDRAEKRRLCGSRRLSPDGEELDGVGHVSRSFILRSAQQEEALHRICLKYFTPCKLNKYVWKIKWSRGRLYVNRRSEV